MPNSPQRNEQIRIQRQIASSLGYSHADIQRLGSYGGERFFRETGINQGYWLISAELDKARLKIGELAKNTSVVITEQNRRNNRRLARYSVGQVVSLESKAALGRINYLRSALGARQNELTTEDLSDIRRSIEVLDNVSFKRGTPLSRVLRRHNLHPGQVPKHYGETP